MPGLGLSLVLALIFLPSSSTPQDHEIIDETNLPRVGELADRTMTQAEEENIKELLRARLYGSLAVEEDPEANAYIRNLLEHIRAGGEIEQEFDILIVRDKQVNAFAMPGGLLAFNTGLLMHARAESELAGVIAHEMAHVTQRHVARMYDKMQHSNVSILATAGILLAGIYSLSALVPAMMVGQSAQIQEYLNHSRASEQEADRFATRFLAHSGIDPRGVANFFYVLLEKSTLPEGKDYEYLSTHPTNMSRIIEAKERALQYKGEFIHDSQEFHYIRERLVSLLLPPHIRIQKLEGIASENPLNDAQQYGLATALQRRGDDERALKILRDIEPEASSLALLVELAIIRALKNLGESDTALKRLLLLNEQYPEHYAIEYLLIQTYLSAGQPKEALKIARARTRRGIGDPQTYRLLAEAANATRQLGVAHLALADYYINRFELRRASQQLELAEKHIKINTANQARIAQRRKVIRQMVEAQM